MTYSLVILEKGDFARVADESSGMKQVVQLMNTNAYPISLDFMNFSLLSIDFN